MGLSIHAIGEPQVAAKAMRIAVSPDWGSKIEAGMEKRKVLKSPISGARRGRSASRAFSVKVAEATVPDCLFSHFYHGLESECGLWVQVCRNGTQAGMYGVDCEDLSLWIGMCTGTHR